MAFDIFWSFQVGCKLDITDSEPGAREVSQAEAKEFATFHGISTFETSAKSGKNVTEAFTSLSQTIYDKIKVIFGCGQQPNRPSNYY